MTAADLHCAAEVNSIACAKKSRPIAADAHAFAWPAQMPLLPVALKEAPLH